MRKILAVGAVILGVALTAGVAAVELARGGGPTLADGLRRTIDLVNTTAAVVAPSGPVGPRPDNAQVDKAGQLRNNHSFSDHSDSIRYPGYNDCDSWKNIVADGWSAYFGVDIPVSGQQNAEQFVKQTQQYWESQGFDVKVQTFSDPSTGSLTTRAWTSTEFARLQVFIDRRRGVASIVGTTHCLPPN